MNVAKIYIKEFKSELNGLLHLFSVRNLKKFIIYKFVFYVLLKVLFYFSAYYVFCIRIVSFIVNGKHFDVLSFPFIRIHSIF